MTLVEPILKPLKKFNEISDIREKGKESQIFGNLPEDPQFYIDLATDYYQEFDEIKASDDEIIEHRRFENLLSELYYFDTRTMDALLAIADLAASGKIASDFGINPLAAIACSYQKENKSSYSLEELIEKLEQYRSIDDMQHNACEVLSLIGKTFEKKP